MKTNLQKNWWVLTINGLLAILFGAMALFATEAVMESISMYFGLLILIGGILLLVGAYDKQRKKINYSLMITEGIILVVLGILIMIFPGMLPAGLEYPGYLIWVLISPYKIFLFSLYLLISAYS